MLDIVLSTQFKKDLKTAAKRGYDLSLLNQVVEALANGKELDQKYHDHKLSGEYSKFRECHLKPDWLLIYSKNDKELLLLLARTGSHADLFS
ncbi:MAG: type II toxin-antitoxin system YafQ family toxin [Spirochaetales bacterium]|nr:type II toxin-antitoxin system YafQ family toxin [Spirochaetales bacterium]MBQ3697621.1 type II toxin-antitoxin system YafQ family toxin [Spirochaetales bacterium]